MAVEGPDELVHALDHVIGSFSDRSVDEETEKAGVKVGEYIESACPGINVGGARRGDLPPS